MKKILTAVLAALAAIGLATAPAHAESAENAYLAEAYENVVTFGENSPLPSNGQLVKIGQGVCNAYAYGYSQNWSADDAAHAASAVIRNGTGWRKGLDISGVHVAAVHKLCPQYIWYMRQSFGS